jgi:hypothetical protein
MDIEQRLLAFAKLGKELASIVLPLADECQDRNPWFTPSELKRAADNWTEALDYDQLKSWVSKYDLGNREPHFPVQVVTAGNIPLVGFHDFLCVLITGNHFQGRLSSRDSILLPALAAKLIGIENGFAGRIGFDEPGTEPKAVIATGSGNTSRFFSREFKSFPSIIRKNRTSVGIIDHSTSEIEFRGMTTDILAYYGLGCRSISHVFLQNPSQLHSLSEVLKNARLADPNPMMDDNLRFQKARLDLGGISYLNSGPVLLLESPSLFSPIGIVHYSYYTDRAQLEYYLEDSSNQLQCITGTGFVKPGFAQKPALWDYSDQVDTISFLLSLKTDE